MGFRGFVGTLVVIGAAAVAFGAYAPDAVDEASPVAGAYAHRLHDLIASSKPPQADAAQSRPGGPSAPLVSVAPVKRADYPLYLEGLGQVQAYNTVTVRTRVDGQVMK